MLTGLSSLFFGSGRADDAAVDQNQASRPTSLNTQDADNGWVLVDVADNQERFEAYHQATEEPFLHNETRAAVREVDRDEQMENQPGRPATGNAVQQQHGQRAARATRAFAQETQQGKLTRVMQRQQRVSKTKQLSKKHLEISNKARMVHSHGRKPASAHSHILKPSGQMNGRHFQRNQ